MTTRINQARVWLGALVGGIVWWLWSFAVNTAMLGRLYADAQAKGLLLLKPRYNLFILYWLITMILLSAVIARFYAQLRQTQGPGPKTALKIGFMVGFCAGFPLAFSQAAWSVLPRTMPLWWCLDLWVGACISAVIAGWLYKDPRVL
jgi:hypothetical protein